jgi:hypothetical protein
MRQCAASVDISQNCGRIESKDVCDPRIDFREAAHDKGRDFEVELTLEIPIHESVTVNGIYSVSS